MTAVFLNYNYAREKLTNALNISLNVFIRIQNKFVSKKSIILIKYIK
jgi:hypothetical protein